MKILISSLMLISSAVLASPAIAGTPVFSENFNAVKPGYYGVNDKLGKFTVTGGDVDVVGDLSGSFYACPFGASNNCVDTNGNRPGSLAAELNLIAGNLYRVTFDLAGNEARPSGVYNLGAALGSSGLQTFSIAAGQPFTSQAFNFTATTTGLASLQFVSQNLDGPGYWGPLLDNVSVEDLSTVTAAPEPATWAMMSLGFFVVGSIVRRRRSGDASRPAGRCHTAAA